MGAVSRGGSGNVSLRADNGTYYKIVVMSGKRKHEAIEATAPLYDYGGETFAIEQRGRGSYNITHTGTGMTLGNVTSLQAAKDKIKTLTSDPAVKRQMQEGAARLDKLIEEYMKRNNRNYGKVR